MIELTQYPERFRLMQKDDICLVNGIEMRIEVIGLDGERRKFLTATQKARCAYKDKKGGYDIFRHVRPIQSEFNLGGPAIVSEDIMVESLRTGKFVIG